MFIFMSYSKYLASMAATKTTKYLKWLRFVISSNSSLFFRSFILSPFFFSITFQTHKTEWKEKGTKKNVFIIDADKCIHLICCTNYSLDWIFVIICYYSFSLCFQCISPLIGSNELQMIPKPNVNISANVLLYICWNFFVLLSAASCWANTNL